MTDLEIFRQALKSWNETHIFCRACHGRGYVDSDEDDFGYPYTAKCIECKGIGNFHIQRDFGF